MFNSKFCTNSLKAEGLIKIKNFLNADQLKKVSSIIFKNRFKKGSKESYFAIDYRTLFLKILNFRVGSFNESLTVLKIYNSLKLKSMSKEYFGCDTKLNMIDGYYNSANDNKDKPIIPWHTDQAYSGSELKYIKNFVNPNDYTLKFFIYLTDIYKDNGCMSYIPGSHKVTYLIRKGIYEGELDYAPYWSINQLVNFISLEKNRNYILKNLDEKNSLDKFISNINKIKNNNHEFDYSLQAGDAIIFNEGLVHKGSKLLYSDRMILRFHFKPIID